jgi:hypothetical protein
LNTFNSNIPQSDMHIICIDSTSTRYNLHLRFRFRLIFTVCENVHIRKDCGNKYNRIMQRTKHDHVLKLDKRFQFQYKRRSSRIFFKSVTFECKRELWHRPHEMMMWKFITAMSIAEKFSDFQY